VEKQVRAGQVTDNDINMADALGIWIFKAKSIHSEYVVLLGFAQQWFLSVKFVRIGYYFFLFLFFHLLKYFILSLFCEGSFPS
jgi:hypothetical protein